VISFYFRGYVFIRLKKIGFEWNVVQKLKNLKSVELDEDWKVTYATPVYGGWDVVVECSFTKKQELDKIIAYIRMDEEISKWIEETTSLVSSKPDYP
jgi:hypothetical protein